MDRIVDSGINLFNAMGHTFCVHAWSAFLQSSVLIVVLLVLDLLLRKRVRAVVRYSVWMLVFAKLILPPTLSLPTGIGYYWPHQTATLQESHGPVVVEKEATRPLPRVELLPASVAAQTAGTIEATRTIAPRDSGAVAPVSPAIARPAMSWQAWVFLSWLAGVLALCICLARRFQYVRKLVIESTPAPDPLQDVLSQCAATLGLRRCPQLRLSDDAPGPVVCRLLSPVILMPTTLTEKVSEDRLKTVLVHELAHIKRADLWINFVQTMLLVAYFYHPLLWLVNAIVRRLREQAVDETVLVALDAEAERYSTTLIDLAEMTFHRPTVGLRLIGIAESKKALQGRIRHMMTRPKPRTARVGVLGVLAVIVIGTVLLPMARAQRRSEPAVTKDSGAATPSPRPAPRGSNRVLASPLTSLERSLVQQVFDMVKEVKERFPDQMTYVVGGPTLYHVDAQGQVTVWSYQELGGHGKDCREDEVSWGSSMLVSATGMYYLPDGTPLSSRWSKRGNGMKDIRVNVGRVVGEDERVGLIHRHRLAEHRDLWSRDGRERTLVLSSWADSCVRLIVRVDQPLGLRRHWVGDVEAVQRDFDGYEQVVMSGPPREDRGPMLVTVALPTGAVPDQDAGAGTGGPANPEARGTREAPVERMDYACVVIEEGVGFDGLVVGDANCTAARIKSKLGEPEEELKSKKTGWWLDYTKPYGLDFWLNLKTGSLGEIRCNEGFKGRLRSGISMASTRADVFRTYGKPLEEKTVRDLTKHFDNQVWYKRGSILSPAKNSKIFYRQHGLLFWFEGDKVRQIVIHRKKPQEAERSDGTPRDDVPDLEARVASQTRLSDLGKVVLFYTVDHDGKLPEKIEDVRDDVRMAMWWLTENVAYLGQGMTTRDNPVRPIAYDKTLIQSGAGTNVLYLDSHVAFESPTRLEELGIKPPPKSADVVQEEAAIQVRAVSRMRLSDLGKALLIYANDHDDEFPETLSGLRGEIKVGMSWLQENVTYLGKGVSPVRDHPARVLAYDEMLLAKGGGTHVLYLDSHLAFETPKVLEKLGIKPVPKSAEAPEIDPAIQARLAVLSNLKQLALAAILYAGENDDVFPDSLKTFEPYLGRDKTLRAWARENVEYVGKGLKAVGGPQASGKPLAYCRPESGAADEVAIAFLDGHVEYVKGSRFKELGIKTAP